MKKKKTINRELLAASGITSLFSAFSGLPQDRVVWPAARDLPLNVENRRLEFGVLTEEQKKDFSSNWQKSDTLYVEAQEKDKLQFLAEKLGDFQVPSLTRIFHSGKETPLRTWLTNSMYKIRLKLYKSSNSTAPSIPVVGDPVLMRVPFKTLPGRSEITKGFTQFWKLQMGVNESQQYYSADGVSLDQQSKDVTLSLWLDEDFADPKPMKIVGVPQDMNLSKITEFVDLKLGLWKRIWLVKINLNREKPTRICFVKDDMFIDRHESIAVVYKTKMDGAKVYEKLVRISQTQFLKPLPEVKYITWYLEFCQSKNSWKRVGRWRSTSLTSLQEEGITAIENNDGYRVLKVDHLFFVTRSYDGVLYEIPRSMVPNVPLQMLCGEVPVTTVESVEDIEELFDESMCYVSSKKNKVDSPKSNKNILEKQASIVPSVLVPFACLLSAIALHWMTFGEGGIFRKNRNAREKS